MKLANNDNVNVGTTYNNDINDNVNKYDRSKMADNIATILQAKLGMKDDSKPFLCKVAYKLPEYKIWDNCEQALKGNNPIGLFIWLCKRDGV